MHHETHPAVPDYDDQAVVGFAPHIAVTMGKVFWSVVVAEVVGRFIRKSGKAPTKKQVDTEVGHIVVGAEPMPSGLERHRYAPAGLAVARRMLATKQQLGNEMSGFDIVGDDDYGSIGYAEDLIGDDDFLDSLIEGEEEDLEELISGDGSSEIIGAASAATGKRKKALRALAMRNAGAVINRGLNRRRRYPLGFVPTAIAAATTIQIPSAPQNLYRPERLVIPSDIAFDIGVGDIKIGNQSQLVQSVEVPAALFSEVAINTGVTFDTAEVGNQVSLVCRNKSAAALEFTAGLVGTIAK